MGIDVVYRSVLASALLASCYHAKYSSGTGEYRGHATHPGEQQVETRQTESFDEQTLRVSVTTALFCRPTLVGDHLEERQVVTEELRGTIPMIVSGVLLTVGGLSIAGIGAAGGSTTDSFGQPKMPDFSESTQQQMEIGGLLAGALGVGEIVYVMTHVGERKRSEWSALRGNPGSVVTSSELHTCGTGTPIAGVPVHVAVSFSGAARNLAWDLTTDDTGTAALEADRTRAIAGWCGEARVTVQTQDSSWAAAVAGQPTPLDQITDRPARDLARACAHQRRESCIERLDRETVAAWHDECLDSCASRVDAQRCTAGRKACLGKSYGSEDEAICASGFAECLDEEGVSAAALDACARDCQDDHASTRCTGEP